MILKAVLILILLFISGIKVSTARRRVDTTIANFSSGVGFRSSSFCLSNSARFCSSNVVFYVCSGGKHLLCKAVPARFPRRAVLGSGAPQVVAKSGQG